MTTKQGLIKQIPWFAHLKERELARLAQCMHRHHYEQGEIIFLKGAPGDSLHLILEGQVRIYTLGINGHEISINIYSAGQVFGEFSLLDEEPRSASAEALTATTTLTLYRFHFQQLLQECPAIASGIIATLVQRVRYTTAYAERLAFMDARGRIASRLLELAERFGIPDPNGICIDVPLTTSDLASLSWATREWTSKVLSTFRKQNLIHMNRSEKRIIIIDASGLRDYMQ